MDINYLLHREQVERMRADRADNDNARGAHAALADAYRDRVARHRRARLAAVGRDRDGPRPMPA